MALSAFAEKARPPSAAEVARVLGAAARPWDELRSHVAGAFPPVSEEWGYPGEKYGWSLRLKRKDRALLYLTPREGRFLVGIVLGEKAVAALAGSGVSEQVLALFRAAKTYVEGTGIRLEVGPDDDLDDLRRLLVLKAAAPPKSPARTKATAGAAPRPSRGRRA